MNMKLLHCLAWKELRSLQALWLTLLATAIVLQVGLMGFFEPSGARWQWLCGVMLAIPTIYALACVSITFAGEREEGTDQFLCRLAAPPGLLLGVKFGLSVLTTAVMFGVLYLWTTLLLKYAVLRSTVLLGDIALDLPNHGMMALAWTTGFLSFGLTFSLLFRRVLPCLIATTVAAGLLPLITTNLLDYILPSKALWTDRLDWMLRLGVVPMLTLVVSAWFVGTWDENRWPRLFERTVETWQKLFAIRSRPTASTSAVDPVGPRWTLILRPFGLCLPDECLPAWRREVRRLLWLEWRQAWRVMLFVLVAFGVYIACQRLFVAWGSVLVAKEFPFVMALVSFVFGAWSFQAQQSGQRFRDFAGHGASPAAMWYIKQGVWFAVTLLTVTLLTTATASLTFGESWRGSERLLQKLAYGFDWTEPPEWSQGPLLIRESLGGVVFGSVLVVGFCFSVGQLVSLLMARAVTVATVGFVLAALAFGWQQLTVHLAIPSVLAVFPTLVGLLLASAVRMTDWLEERNSIRGWLRVIVACVVPSLVTLFGVPIYRVLEIPAVSSTSGYGIQIAELLNQATDDVPATAKQTAERWMRLAESLEDEPHFEWTQIRESVETGGEIKSERDDIPGSFFDIHHEWFVWANLKNRDWLARHSNLVVEAARIAQEPNCAFDPEIFEGVDHRANVRIKRLSHLGVLLKMAAEAAMAEGKLDEALQHWLVLLRLSEHIQQHAPWDSVRVGERLEIAAWSFLLHWSRHPAQTGDSLRAALGRSVNAMPHPLLKALKDHVELVPRKSNVVLEEYSTEKRDLEQYWREVRWPLSWMFWEREREERLLDFSGAVALVEMGGYLRSPVSWQGDDQLVYHWGRTPQQRINVEFLHGTTRFLSPSRRHSFVWTSYSHDWQRSNEHAEAATWRRGLIVTIALRAFQLDHGRLPSQWDELIGPYLDKVPVDPWNGLLFELRPQGYPFEIEILGSRIPARTPLFVSRGPNGQQLTPSVRPSKNDKELPTTEWVLTGGPWGTEPWPPTERQEGPLTLIAFPLSATEP